MLWCARWVDGGAGRPSRSCLPHANCTTHPICGLSDVQARRRVSSCLQVGPTNDPSAPDFTLPKIRGFVYDGSLIQPPQPRHIYRLGISMSGRPEPPAQRPDRALRHDAFSVEPGGLFCFTSLNLSAFSFSIVASFGDDGHKADVRVAVAHP